MGFRLNLNWCGLSVQSPLSTSTSSWPTSSSCRGRDSSYFLARSSAASVIYGDTETLNDTSRGIHVYPSSHQLLENYYLGGAKQLKVALGKGSSDSLYSLLDSDIQIPKNEDKLENLTSVQATQASKLRLLMKNLDVLEDMFADSNAVRLEGDILEQLERLGALRLFHSCLSRTIKSYTSFDLSDGPTEIVEECARVNDSVDNHLGKVFVHSGKKELRKLRRKRTSDNESPTIQESPSKTISKDLQQLKFAIAGRTPRSRNKRQKTARNEADMSSGVKRVAELEKIRTKLEQETGQIASLSNWAEAAGIKKKELQQHLHYGWHCRDELLRSTHSLVLFIARNYSGLGVAFEDLIQAGNIGVLQGAERFDQSRGYKFSTYVQYWIRKSMSTLVAKHARGVRIPCTLSKVINQVHKARKALTTSNGKYPDDYEIAKFTGLSVAKVMSASKCLRVVGSIDQKIGEYMTTKYMEILSDTSMPSPEEAVIRQHMLNDVSTLLNGLEPREKQVIILRFGLGNCQCKSLEEIGRLFRVSKEWIRKIERSALIKLRNEDSLKILNHYVHMQ
ncbi:PREDICTED: RNA polymerase sigma factor sigC [Erythranthe guttata]|uniref:RNA polymerase sigma factor sigC n=1 Tax=Erythranthe guttata TaxID=4155 RepID=UPI00064D9580|nr:PREDICTED: RNA polymerase sigma factor sigC [Erythranthe guttata]|eukprot:XP_012857954.1 PREDICTED: RNA polymerase sigma factor sigC [Erythranthe guttata]